MLRWQRRRLRDFLRLRSKSRPGSSRIPRSHINLIKRISRDHPEYGAARIALELAIKFGVNHAESTIEHYRFRGPRDSDSSQKWRTFLKNNVDAIWTADFFTQYTVGFRALYVFVIMHLASRMVVHFGITEHPTLDWIKQQVRYATFDNVQPEFLIHDNDGRYGQPSSSTSTTTGPGSIKASWPFQIRIRRSLNSSQARAPERSPLRGITSS